MAPITDDRIESVAWPPRVAVIGGGRWAREYVKALGGLVPATVGVSMHSPHNADGVAAWATTLRSRQVEVSSEWPKRGSASTAVIVANAARDHERAVEWAAAEGWPVLVEKPMALTGQGAERLMDLAGKSGVRLAAAHIFLFTTYLHNYSGLITRAGRVRSVRVRWTDPPSEIRYGERKAYDPTLPVFADWLPHICALSSAFEFGPPDRCDSVDARNGGAHLEIALRVRDIPFNVELVRNSDRRRRTIDIVAGEETIRLDSSEEPGTITRGSVSMVADPEWKAGQRPLAQMLAAFLKWAAGGPADRRLDSGIAVKACRITDQVGEKYRAIMLPWLLGKLADGGGVDDDLRYALSELLQSDGGLAAATLEAKIELVTRGFAGANRANLLARLAEAEDPGAELRGIAR